MRSRGSLGNTTVMFMHSARKNSASQSALWAPALKSCERPVLRLFCFPYAGGGLPVFRAWPGAFPASVEIRVVQLPGRGPRFREKCFEDLNHLAGIIASEIEPLLDKPFAFFGHSLGALLAFETARRLRQKNFAPLHLFSSGNNAPHLPRHLPAIHKLPDGLFLEQLKVLNGIHPAVLDSKELIELFLPAIRSDFTMLETYSCDPSSAPFDCPVTVFGGLEDPRTTRDGLEAWKAQTTQKFELVMLPGNHFFLDTARPLMLQTIVNKVREQSE